MRGWFLTVLTPTDSLIFSLSFCPSGTSIEKFWSNAAVKMKNSILASASPMHWRRPARTDEKKVAIYNHIFGKIQHSSKIYCKKKCNPFIFVRK